jgi:transcriptional regulator with XRE-family HTH domain
VETKKEIQEFLTSRRAAITPEQAGGPSYGARRVPGLRREEVAVLAGVSVPYYTRLERGDLSGVSQGVLEALAGALKLDDAERAHLFDLARAAQPTGAPKRRRVRRARIRPEVQWTLDAITGAAAYVGNDRLDILAANSLGRALFPTGTLPPEPQPRFCARLPGVTQTTVSYQTSSASSRPRAMCSAPTGRSTTSASMRPPSSTSTTPSSVSSSSASTAWTSPPTTA